MHSSTQTALPVLQNERSDILDVLRGDTQPNWAWDIQFFMPLVLFHFVWLILQLFVYAG
jgi:hypothetical protein